MSVSSASNLVTGQPAAKGRKRREGRLNKEYRILNCTEYEILNVERKRELKSTELNTREKTQLKNLTFLSPPHAEKWPKNNPVLRYV